MLATVMKFLGDLRAERQKETTDALGTYRAAVAGLGTGKALAPAALAKLKAAMDELRLTTADLEADVKAWEQFEGLKAHRAEWSDAKAAELEAEGRRATAEAERLLAASREEKGKGVIAWARVSTCTYAAQNLDDHRRQHPRLFADPAALAAVAETKTTPASHPVGMVFVDMSALR